MLQYLAKQVPEIVTAQIIGPQWSMVVIVFAKDWHGQ